MSRSEAAESGGGEEMGLGSPVPAGNVTEVRTLHRAVNSPGAN
jgi:hypothetical protein